MSFKKYFVTDTIISEAKTEDKKENVKPQKISGDFESELRKLHKIKSVINTAFGIQIDFFKKPLKDEILELVDSKVKFKDNSIFIEF